MTKPTKAQRRLLESLSVLGPDEYCMTATVPRLRNGTLRSVEKCVQNGWVTSERTRMFYRTITITPKGLEALK